MRPDLRNAEDDLTGESASHGTKTASMLMSANGAPDAAEFPNYAVTKAIWGVAPKVEVIPYRVFAAGVLAGRALAARAAAAD